METADRFFNWLPRRKSENAGAAQAPNSGSRSGVGFARFTPAPKLGKPDDVIRKYDEALSLAPNDAYNLYDRGRASGKIAKVKSDFRHRGERPFRSAESEEVSLPGVGWNPLRNAQFFGKKVTEQRITD